ncbi:MAG: putative toxin-antitoxin system toxin component, PIN family [Spirosomataceae bacterium]
MRVILDTNVLLVSIGKKSPYRPIFDAFLANQFTLVISNDLLLEYAEIIEHKTNILVATNIIEMLLSKSNVEKKDIYFKWGLLTSDYDDNKFVDTAIVGSVDFIVTNDKHFNPLKDIDFPKVETITIDNFLEIIKALI